jgi:hypothetical protein
MDIPRRKLPNPTFCLTQGCRSRAPVHPRGGPHHYRRADLRPGDPASRPAPRRGRHPLPCRLARSSPPGKASKWAPTRSRPDLGFPPRRVCPRRTMMGDRRSSLDRAVVITPYRFGRLVWLTTGPHLVSPFKLGLPCPHSRSGPVQCGAAWVSSDLAHDIFFREYWLCFSKIWEIAKFVEN